MNGTGDGQRFEIPGGISQEEERAILMALERYLSAENPRPSPWVLQGRVEATGQGTLQIRRYAHEPWHGQQAAFARRGVAPMHGRSDVR